MLLKRFALIGQEGKMIRLESTNPEYEPREFPAVAFRSIYPAVKGDGFLAACRKSLIPKRRKSSGRNALTFWSRNANLSLRQSIMSDIMAPGESEAWKAIAGVDGLDRITHVHIRNLLQANGIESRTEGSILYDVLVPASEAERASHILRTDAQQRGYFAMFERGDRRSAPEFKQILRDSPIASVLQTAEYSAETTLGRFLRTKKLSEVISKYPFLVSLSVHERQYMATPETVDVGYDVEVKLQGQGALGERTPGYRGSYQVYESGNEVVLNGWCEWHFESNCGNETGMG